MTPQEHIKQEGGWLRRFERKLDKCNHLMELMRTCLGLCTLVLQVIILLKLFNLFLQKGGKFNKVNIKDINFDEEKPIFKTETQSYIFDKAVIACGAF